MKDGGGPYGAPLVKPWWQSRTIIGVAVMLLSQILRAAKVDIIDAELTDILTLCLDTVGAGLAIYGRIDARHKLKLTRPGGPFNPRAEVRRGKRAGQVRWSVVFSMAGIACFWFAITCLVLWWVAPK